jgi:hypothetical protein
LTSQNTKKRILVVDNEQDMIAKTKKLSLCFNGGIKQRGDTNDSNNGDSSDNDSNDNEEDNTGQPNE